MFTQSFFANPDTKVPHCHSATICRLASGTMLVVWYAYPEIETVRGRIILTRQRAGQSQWEPPRHILANLQGNLANPVLFEDGDGVLWLLYVTLQGRYWDSAVTMMSKSTDEGSSWSSPETFSQTANCMVRHRALVRSDKSLILPAYDERVNETVLMARDPYFPKWIECHRFKGSKAIQGDIVAEDAANWSLFLRPVEDPRVCLRAISKDEGITWSPLIRTEIPNPLSGQAAFHSDGAICVIHNHTKEHRRYPLSLCYSKDRGVSWSEPKHIDTAEHEVSYPSFLVDPSGIVHGVYTFDRKRIKYVSFDPSWWRA